VDDLREDICAIGEHIEALEITRIDISPRVAGVDGTNTVVGGKKARCLRGDGSNETN